MCGLNAIYGSLRKVKQFAIVTSDVDQLTLVVKQFAIVISSDVDQLTLV